MPELQLLNADHAPAVLAFELTNRTYFAASVPDRGDEYFERFADWIEALMVDQEAGVAAFYVLVGDDSSVLGRFNLDAFDDGTADLGYRVAEHVAGRGVATSTLRELCRLAAARHGLNRLRAAAADDNPASRKVLINTGFVPVGPADPADIGGKVGAWYELELGQVPPE